VAWGSLGPIQARHGRGYWGPGIQFNYSGYNPMNDSSPAIGADEIIYISFHDEVVAVGAEVFYSRKSVWEYKTDEHVSSSPAISSDGIVYFGSDDGNVYALDGQTGPRKSLFKRSKPIWKFNTGGRVKSSPAIGADGTVFVGSCDGRVYALDGQTGNRKWDFMTGHQVWSSPAIGVDGTIYIGSHDKKIYALDGKNGQVKWEYETGGHVDSSPAISVDGTIYIGSHDGKVYALDEESGKNKWVYEAGDYVQTSPVIGVDGTVYIGSVSECLPDKEKARYGFRPIGDCHKRALYALDGQSGIEKWAFRTDSVLHDGTSPSSSRAEQGETLQAIPGRGPANSPWPMFRQNPQRTGRAAK